MSGPGCKKNPSQNQVGSVARPSIDPLANGPPPLGPSVGSKGSKLAGGLFLPGPLADLKLKGAAADEAGPSSSKAAWWVDEVESISTLGLVGLEGDSSPGPSQSHLLDIAQSGKARPLAWHGLRSWSNPEAEFLQLWEMEVLRKQQIEDQQTTIDHALVEEAMRLFWLLGEKGILGLLLLLLFLLVGLQWGSITIILGH